MKEISFNEFVEQLREALYQRVDKYTKIDVHETTKNNGITYHGLIIMKKGCNIFPNIRLEGFYASFKERISTLGEIADEIMDIFESECGKNNLELNFFTDFQRAKEQIMFKIINYEGNRKRLENLPHIKFLDLALTFYYSVEQEEIPGVKASIQIEKSHLELWGIDEGALYDLAMKNTVKKMPASCRTIFDIILNILEEDGITPGKKAIDDFKEKSGEVPMYVLTNPKNYFGAAVLYYPGVLKNIGKAFGSDLIVLPSSIHEVILLPAKKWTDYDSLNEMIEDINENHVAKEEVLSNHFYYYDLERDELRTPD